MKIRADLTQRAVVESATLDWVASPAAGVERKMLERDGDEVARATSLVRYAPGSRFAPHEHGGGEEFLVLEGTFSDEHGHYGPGTYIRNPIGSRHAPFSEAGCVILVKLRQMSDPAEQRLVADTRTGAWNPAAVEGLERMPLFADEAGGEQVYLVRFAPGAKVEDDPHPGGEELFVLEGTLEDEFGAYPAGTWLRQPDGSRHAPFSTSGCTLWVKRGHLPRAASAQRSA
jgi:anti-sigma factor ChrR (cupin superfamily)